MTLFFPLVSLALAIGCSSNKSSPPPDNGTPDASISGPVAGQDTTVVGFDKKRIYFDGNGNNRTADVTASFPASGSYSAITMHLALDCPTGGCDAWDRFATIGVVKAGAGPNGADLVIEIARFITPYGVAAKWDVDLTSLRPLLTGDVTLRAFIDTWVPQGGSNQYGAGWNVSTTFDMTGGVPDRDPVAVVPVWDRRSVTYGDPAKPIAGSVPPASVDLGPLASAGATSYDVRAFITGHGQGNAENCAEFCPKTHTITVASKAHAQKQWRTDCAKTGVPHQLGNATSPRAGWCPGATVTAWTFDATEDLVGATSASITYDVESYDNTCRPSLAPDAGTADAGPAACAGCYFSGVTCTYDGGLHTEPLYWVSTLLIGYRVSAPASGN